MLESSFFDVLLYLFIVPAWLPAMFTVDSVLYAQQTEHSSLQLLLIESLFNNKIIVVTIVPANDRLARTIEV